VEKLHWLLARKKDLTERLIAGTPGMPSTITYYRRFGRLPRIHAMLGNTLDPSRFYGERMRALRRNLLTTLTRLFPTKLSVFCLPGKQRPILRLDNDTVISILMCSKSRLSSGESVWRLNAIPGELQNPALLCLTDVRRSRICQMYLVPRVVVKFTQFLRTGDRLLRSGVRLASLSELYEAAHLLRHD
jgi:hypothetical protein